MLFDVSTLVPLMLDRTGYQLIWAALLVLVGACQLGTAWALWGDSTGA